MRDPLVRRFLVVGSVTALAAAGLTITRAIVVASVLATLVEHGPAAALAAVPVRTVLGVVAGHAALAWFDHVHLAGGATAITGALRARLLSAATAPARGPGAATTVRLLTDGLDAVHGYVTGWLGVLPAAVLVAPAVLAAIIVVDPTSGLVVAATVPFVPALLALAGTYTKQRVTHRIAVLDRLAGQFLQALTGLTTLRVFGRSGQAVDRLSAIAQQHRTLTRATLRVAFLSTLVLDTTTSLAVALTAVPVGLRLLSGGLQLATGLSVLLLTPELFRSLRAMGTAFHAAADGRAALREIDAACAESPARTATPAAAAAALDPARSPVVLRDVATGVTAPVLDHVDLTLHPGRIHVLAGPNGAGKTTLIRTIAGVLPPLHGRITCGDVDLAEADPNAWSATIGGMPQRPHLFAASVADNVRLARPEADAADVWAALEAAGAADFVHGLPDRAATMLGDRGAGLSAGQRQRLALARTFLRRPALLLLDEPTEHLDGAAEEHVLASLAALGGRTTILIATHRPRAVEIGDVVWTVRDGRVAPARPSLVAS
jgi:ATP-binding cassette, subfamily C, bacterial CydD